MCKTQRPSHLLALSDSTHITLNKTSDMAGLRKVTDAVYCYILPM